MSVSAFGFLCRAGAMYQKTYALECSRKHSVEWGVDEWWGKRTSWRGLVAAPNLLPPGPPTCGLPGHWDPGARPELRTAVQSAAQVGATPVAAQPVEPLRGESETSRCPLSRAGLPLRGSTKFISGLDLQPATKVSTNFAIAARLDLLTTGFEV